MKKFVPTLIKALKKFDMISPGDKIAVGVSGGKDSLFLLKLLSFYRDHVDHSFDIIAIFVDQTNGSANTQKLQNFCNECGVDFFAKSTNIFEVVFEVRSEKNPCSLCSKMRRASLLEYAKELGCNKVALGHHADDLINTFLLSLFYEGRLSTFAPVTYMSRVDITTIRPLMFVWESQIEKLKNTLPVLQNSCPADKHTKREDVKKLLQELESKHPDIKKQIFAALCNPERFNVLGKKLSD